MQINKSINKLISQKHAKQSISLMIWNFVSIPLTIVTNIMITRSLGAEDYGNYLYIQKLFDFAFIILNFGLLCALNRAILLSKDESHTKELYGSGLIVLTGIYVVICLALTIFALVVPELSNKGILTTFFCVLPFSIIHFMMQYFEQALPSSNRIKELIQERYLPRLGLLLGSCGLYLLLTKGNIECNPMSIMWVILLSTQLIVFTYVLYRIKPSFGNISGRIKEIFTFNKEFGFKIYVGNLFSTAFSALLPLLIGFVSENNSEVGFYALALSFAHIISFCPIVIATSHYKKFAEYDKIPNKIMLATIGITVFALLCLCILIGPFITIFYSEEFQPVIQLSYITGIGATLYGLSDFFSRYFMAKGNGDFLRNSSFLVGFCTLTFSLLLVPTYKDFGAATAYVLSGSVYMICSIAYYIYSNRKRQKLNSN